MFRTKLGSMKKGILLLLQLILPALLSVDLVAQSYAYMIDHFPEISNSVSEEEASLFSMVVNDIPVFSSEFKPDAEYTFTHREFDLQAKLSDSGQGQEYGCWLLRFINNSEDTLELENLVPLGFCETRPCITGSGPPGLSRARGGSPLRALRGSRGRGARGEEAGPRRSARS